MIYLQEICFFIIMIIASFEDIKKLYVPDFIHLLIIITAFFNFRTDLLGTMFLGALITALPLYIAAFFKHDSIGGADIKFMAASGFVLGAGKGLSALIIGLTVSVIFILIYRKLKRLNTKMAFPLIPFLSIGNIVAFII